MSDQPSANRPRWYSIKDAAEYLDIGEPTLYRWMREGKITYRKVGDSTRFWREDLDAMMEVFHSEKGLTSLKKACSTCHQGELVPGAFRSTGLMYFQPKKTKFWTLQDSNVEVEGYMCNRCGSVFLFGDTEKLTKLTEQQGANGQPSEVTDPAP